MRRTSGVGLAILIAIAIAIPAEALDARCETNPDHPKCQVEDPPPSPVPPEGDFHDWISVIGCSNTRNAAVGYSEVSFQDLLVNTARAGETMTVWATSPSVWDEQYLPMRPVDGYDGAWINLCERAVSGLSQLNVEAVIAKVWEIDPDIPIWISPLNFYDTEDCEVTNGNQIPSEGVAIADSLAAEHTNVFRGPDLGPLTADMLRRDACHQNEEGITFNGTQLVAFFDQ